MYKLDVGVHHIQCVFHTTTLHIFPGFYFKALGSQYNRIYPYYLTTGVIKFHHITPHQFLTA